MCVKKVVTTPRVPPRQDYYQHFTFNQLSDAELVHTALRVHAEGYTTMGFVSGDAVNPDGTLDESIDHSRGCFTDYYLAVKPDNPEDMATMRKIHIASGSSVTDLPGFGLCREGLHQNTINYLNELEMSGFCIKEMAGLARTKSAPAAVVYELLRFAIQGALGNDEIWYFCLVLDTFDSLAKYFGRSTFIVIGEDVKLSDERVSERIQLRPSIVVLDKLFVSMIKDAEEARDSKAQQKILGMLLYITEGLDDSKLGEEVADYRRKLLTFAN